MTIADRVYWLHAISPLHLGAGKGNGYIDLPLMREKVTGFPFVPGSSTKGVFADLHQATEEARDPSNAEYKGVLHAAFGRGGDDAANSGALTFTDARLICLPVRSLYGTFAWCSCPMILRRLRRDLELCGGRDLPDVSSLSSQAHAVIDRCVLAKNNIAYLEDLNITVQGCPNATGWANVISRAVFSDEKWQTLFVARFLVLPDDLFSFLAETGTEVQAHIRIDPDYKKGAEGCSLVRGKFACRNYSRGVRPLSRPVR